MTNRDQRLDRLQKLVEELVSSDPFIRSGLLHVSSDTHHWAVAAGHADPDAELEMEVQDQFVIDSIGKMMTATLALQLSEEGRLLLDAPIGEFISPEVLGGLEVFDGGPFGERVTVRQLLGHRSGLADDWNTPGFLVQILQDPQRRWRPEETIDFVRTHASPAFPPGQGFLYSDPGFNLIGLAIEAASGESLHERMRTQIFEPLGMEHTYRPSHESAILSPLHRGVSNRYLEAQEGTLVPAVITADWAGGGLVSTAPDLARFLRALVKGELFVSRATLDQMIAWQSSSAFTDYGLGMARVDFSRSEIPDAAALGEVWGHAGSSHCFAYYWPREDLVLIGTLNQIVTDTSVYETAARCMQTILATSSASDSEAD